MPYQDEDRDSAPTKWVAIFVLLSILAHAVIILAVILLAAYVPAPKLDAPPQTPPTVNVTLMPQPPPKQRPFMPTEAQTNVKPKNTLVESDNDVNLTSQSKQNRTADSIMPDVVSKVQHSSQLQDSPNSPSKQPPQQATAPPTAKQEDQPKKQETPPQPQPSKQADQTPPPPKPTTEPPPPKPKPVPPPPKVVQNPVDPNTGLPVLPPIDAPTIAPQSPVNPNQKAQAAIPPPILQSTAQDIQGRAGMSGKPSPEAMATELGRYKAKFYRAVGSRWYPKVNNQLSLLGVGVVRVQYTIYPDGTITTKVLEGGSGSLMLLLTISVNSIREVSPFDAFPDSMRKQYPDGYTDDFSFSIYGGG